MNTTITPIVYAGETVGEQLSPDQHKLVRDALMASRTVNPVAEHDLAISMVGSRDLAYGELLPAENTAKAIAALIAVEDMLNDEDVQVFGESLLAKVQRALRATGRRLVERFTRGWLAMDIWVILDNDTSDYDLSTFKVKGAKSRIESIESVWFFDRSKHVHLCELTGSYELNFLEVRANLKLKFHDNEKAEEIRDAVEYELREPDVYAEVDYRHVHSVNRFIEANALGTVYHFGNPGLDLDEVRDEVLDRLGRNMNEARKRKGEPPLSDVEIEKEWADHLDEQIEMAVMESVRESLQSNSVL